MYRQLKTVFVLLCVVLAALAFKTVMQRSTVENARGLSLPDKIGINEELMTRIDQLERDIARRLTYEVELTRDPLKLNTVIHASRGGSGTEKEFAEQHRLLRLSCTILSPTQKTAVIKYRSKSYVVSEGDTICGETVKYIGSKRVVLISGNGETELVNSPAPAAEKILDQKRVDNEIKL